MSIDTRVFTTSSDFQSQNMNDFSFSTSMALTSGIGGYPTTNPFVTFVTPFYATSISNFGSTLSTPPGSDIRFLLLVNQQPKYWNGSSWVDSDGSYSQANSSTDMSINIASFPWSNYRFPIVNISVFLHSDDGTVTPNISALFLDLETYPFTPKGSEPNLCFIQGYIEDLIGNTPNDFVLKAHSYTPYFNGAAFIPVCTSRFYPTVVSPGTPQAVSGYLSIPLRETETSGTLVAFQATYTDDGISRTIAFEPVTIPNQTQIDIWDLLIPII